MEDKQLQKEKDIKNRLLIAIVLASVAVLLTIFDLPLDFLLALLAYILVGIAVVKKDGAMGIMQVILVFPAIFKSIGNFFDGGSDAGDVDLSKSRKLEGLANFALFYSAIVILVTIFYPIFRFIWNLFT